MKINLMKRIIGIALIIVMFVGCSAPNDVNQKGVEQDSKDKKIKLSMIHMNTEGESHHVPWRNAVDKFLADNPEVELVEEVIPHDAYLLKIQTLAAAGELPDISLLNGTMINTYANTGDILPLTTYLEADQEWYNRFYEESFLESTVNGEIFAIPRGYDCYGYAIYNKEIFEECGIDEFPKTISELYTTIDKIKEKGYIPIALGDKALWPADSIFFSAFVNKFTGNEWSEDIFARKGNSKFTDQEFIDALTAFQGIADRDGFNSDMLSIDNDQRLTLYMNGKAAMISAGNWEIPVIDSTSPEIAAVSHFAPWPNPDKNVNAGDSVVKSAPWGISVGSNIDEEAIPYVIDFLENYYTSEDYGRYMIEEKNKFPAFVVEEFDENAFTELKVREQELVQESVGCLNYDSILPATVKEVYQRGLQEMLIGALSPEELAKQMQEEYEQIVK